MKLVKEILYEKFEEHSDPIKDMGIGTKRHIKECIKKLIYLDRSDAEHAENWYMEAAGYFTVDFTLFFASYLGVYNYFMKFFEQSGLNEYMKVYRKIEIENDIDPSSIIWKCKPVYKEIFYEIYEENDWKLDE